MTADTPTRTLIVANRTASTPALLEEVTRRAHAGARFTVMIPPEAGDHAPDWTPEEAQESLQRAARAPVDGLACGEDAVVTIRRVIEAEEYDELLVCTAPAHHARWLHHDLPHRLLHLGTPVTIIPPEQTSWQPIEGFPDAWGAHALPGGIQ